MRVLAGVLVALFGAVAGAAIGVGLTFALLSGEDADAFVWLASFIFFCFFAIPIGAVGASLQCWLLFPEVFGFGAAVGYGIGAALVVMVLGPVVALSWPIGGGTSAPAHFLAGKLCGKQGIRYTGETPQGVRVCFTLTPDRSTLVELGWRFHGRGTSDCPGGATYSDSEYTLGNPGHITEPGFSATIRGARASGVLKDPELCPGKTLKWSARRQP